MISFSKLLKESRGRSLSVFDFDHTIASADAWVYVTHSDGTKSKLDPGEFATYEPKPNDSFDFSEFDRMMQNPKLIRRNANKLRAELEKAQKTSSHKVTILTARSIGYPVKHFLSRLGLNAYIVPLGSGDPKAKADWIENHIKKGYTDIFFIDDSTKNVEAVKQLSQKYPNVRIKAVVA